MTEGLGKRGAILDKKEPLDVAINKDGTLEVIRDDDIPSNIKRRVVVALNGFEQMQYGKLDEGGRLHYVKALVAKIVSQ